MSSRIEGVGATAPTPDRNRHGDDDELLAVLAAFPGSELISAQVGARIGMCARPDRHAARHHAHPITGRVVCWICHPPASVDGTGTRI